MTPDLARKKAVEAVFKNKIKIGHFNESLVQETLTVGLSVSILFVIFFIFYKY